MASKIFKSSGGDVLKPRFVTLFKNSLKSPIRFKLVDGTVLTYIHNLDSGGMSIFSYLWDRIEDGSIVEWQRSDDKLNLSEFQTHLSVQGFGDDMGTVFSVVRNPYSRMRVGYERWRTASSNNKLEISGYLETGRHLPMKTRPQHVYTEGADIILRYEDLHNEFIDKIVNPYFDLSKGGLVGVDGINFNGAKDDMTFVTHMTEKAKSIVKTYDAVTFANFGYTEYV